MRILNIMSVVMLSTIIGCAGLNSNTFQQKDAECKSWSTPVMKEWVGYNRLTCIWKSLQNEKIQKIGFCCWVTIDPNRGSLSAEPDKLSPEEWICDDIVEPEKIKEVMKLLGKAIKKSHDGFANKEEIEDSKCGFWWMRIVTDKQKVIIRVACWEDNKSIRGVGWTSYELMEKLKQWNPDLYPW